MSDEKPVSRFEWLMAEGLQEKLKAIDPKLPEQLAYLWQVHQGAQASATEILDPGFDETGEFPDRDLFLDAIRRVREEIHARLDLLEYQLVAIDLLKSSRE